MQHQYWKTRRSVLRKFGNKEDECVVASDAELDAKLALFRSVADTCAALKRLADRYLEKVAALAAEELALGKFLEESGSRARGSRGNAGAGAALAAAGEGLTGCGRRRGSTRATLARLGHELETFGGRGVDDCGRTVAEVERARNEYRAALAWMKAASSELDPDSGRGLHEFRKAQARVKDSKARFDRITLDTLQKIDLLAAARCNMFSHALINYQSTLLNFAARAAETAEATERALAEAEETRPDFGAFGEFPEDVSNSNGEVGGDGRSSASRTVADRSKQAEEIEDAPRSETARLVETAESIPVDAKNDEIFGELSMLNFGDIEDVLPSRLIGSKSFWKDDGLTPERPPPVPSEGTFEGKKSRPIDKKNADDRDAVAWFKLFAELDPLSNPDSMPGSDRNRSHAA